MFAGLLLSVVGSPVQADPAAGLFEVRSAFAQVDNGVYYVNAKVDYTLSETAREALMSGVTLTLEVQIEVDRIRRYFPDKNVASLRQQYQLQYHALSERYVTLNLNSGEQLTFGSLSAAVRSLGTINSLPVLDAALLNPDKRYEIRLRAVLDIRSFPGPLRLLAALFDEWRLASEWFVWPLQP